MTDPTNDNEAAMPLGVSTLSDPNGQAAILLVESLIHSLVARSVLSVRDAIDIVEVAGDVTVEVADAPDAHRAVQSPSTILENIAGSLSHDLAKD